MEEEGPINFKALRAKFQEEALLAKSKARRPAVAEKPKHLPPPGGQCSSVVSGISIAVENKTPAVPRVFVRNGLQASGGKRPISFPPQHQQTSLSSNPANGDGTPRMSFKERHMPLVLPVLPVKEQKMEAPVKRDNKLEAGAGREDLPHTKFKKKGLLLPFKSSKAAKVCAENGEEPTYADLTMRPSSAPGELPSMERQLAEDCSSLQNDQSTFEGPLSSSDVALTPPSSETSIDSESRIISTLERAKKKFSCRQMLLSGKSKSLRSPDYTSRDRAFPLPLRSAEGVEPDIPAPPPVCLPHLACISARPFVKANSSSRKLALAKQMSRDQAECLPVTTSTEHHPPPVPPKKLLPDLSQLGSLPAKPPRPPLVDLSRYHPPTGHVVPAAHCQTATQMSESPLLSVPNPVLDAPEFPEFENLELEPVQEGAVNIAALELEALDLVSSDLPLPVDFGVTDWGVSQPSLSDCDPTDLSVSSVAHDLNIGGQNKIPLDPASFPEPINLSEFSESFAPDEWSQSEELIVDNPCHPKTNDTDLGAAECHSVQEDTELSSHADLNDCSQPHSNDFQQDSYYETCDNVYEDVENINRAVLGQNSRKHRASLKNPYADNHPMREEGSLNMWPRNPWGSASGEHVQPTYNHVHRDFVFSRERQSPNTADIKEQKKREKQRLEREKKEQKEREKKENEMRKKFKVTGEEEPMYHAKVMVASKVRKHDLPVKSGDTVSIIRTTNCPKGKWLARDTNHKYGYISVMNVELNIKEMLELGKKAQAAGRGGNLDGDTISIGSRSSSHPVLTSSFTDDSEEWACEDQTVSPSNESHRFPRQTSSMSEISCSHVSAQHTLSDANLEDLHTQTRHEALQKLAIFFQHSKEEFDDIADGDGVTPTNAEPPDFLCAVEEPPYPEHEVDFTELGLLPPPPLYADAF